MAEDIEAITGPEAASALSAVVQRELEHDRKNFVIRGVVGRESFDQICNERDKLQRETEKLRDALAWALNGIVDDDPHLIEEATDEWKAVYSAARALLN